MQKTIKFLSFTHIALSIFLLIIYIQNLLTSNSGDGSWADLGFFLVMFAFLIITIVLTIPFLIIGIKNKFKEMNLYLLAYGTYTGLSVLLFILSLK